MPRVNRTAAARQQQYARANAKVTQLLLRNFQALQHRGCQTSKLGHALIVALSLNKDHEAISIKHAIQELAFTPSDDPAVISWATANATAALDYPRFEDSKLTKRTLNPDAPIFTPFSGKAQLLTDEVQCESCGMIFAANDMSLVCQHSWL